jgi:hypothetical protein
VTPRRPEGRSSRAPQGPRPSRIVSFALWLAAAIGILQFSSPARPLLQERAQATVADLLPSVVPSPNAFGKSGEVRVRFTLPGERVEYPLEVRGDPTRLAYQWVRAGDTLAVDSTRTLTGSSLVAPPEPGFYQLALVRDGQREVVDGITLTVLMPFSQKLGSTLNGFKIGTYIAERLDDAREPPPEGFVQVAASDVNRPVSKHFRLADFMTHDDQDIWPKYVALSPRLLDKLELVLGELTRGREAGAGTQLTLDVHSGFRTPSYNRTVSRAARDSRHQYGDAADVVIDANGDGRFTVADSRLVALAVEAVERDHPELAGGMGLYTSRRYATPYVHIDARGRRARWQG